MGWGGGRVYLEGGRKEKELETNRADTCLSSEQGWGRGI
jgi:hypothetical protein